MGDGLGATKTRLFGKKSGGTPNPQVKKVGVTPNLDQIFAWAAARAAPAGRGAYLTTLILDNIHVILFSTSCS